MSPVQRIFYSPRYIADLTRPDGTAHIMPIHKFALVADGIAASGHACTLEAPAPATDAELLRVHTPEYLRAIADGTPKELAESQKFPWTPGLADAVRWTNGGCIAALTAALDARDAGRSGAVSANLASGFHHAHADHGEGFCTFNGLVVAYEALRAAGRLERALVLDMDLHYGNGTAALIADRPGLCQLSIYGNGYHRNTAYRDVYAIPTPDTTNAWSVPVPNGTGRDGYLGLLEEHLPRAIARARPEVILYQAGADPFKEDPYSPLDLDHAALHARDARVFAIARAAGIPVMWVLAGGYTKDVTRVVEVHLNTFRASVGAPAGA